MNTGSEPDAVARMDVPPEGGCCGAVVALVFVGAFVALAADNLADWSATHVIGIVASVLWLGLVVFVLVVGVWAAGGVWASVVAILGMYSWRHFAEASRDGDQTVIGFGYELLGRRFYFLRVERERILSVTMNTGQATALAGRDMNDWSVVFWYRDPNVRRKSVAGIRDGEVYIVGPAQAKATTEEFFRSFVEFLRAAGVELEPGTREYELRAAGPDNPPNLVA